MSTRIRFRRDTAANWTSNNPTLTTGELGYETDTGKFKIGNNTNAWTALAYSITSELSEGNLNDLKDVTITSAANGDFLRWNGTAWINDAVNLSTDTVGSFVESLVAGTGITLTNNSGEGATPTVAVDTSAIQAKVANVTDTEIGYLDGVTSAIQTQIDTKAPLASPTFTGTVTLPSGTVTSGMILDGTIDNVDISSSAAIADSKLATISTASKVSNSATTATDANTASSIVARDASGNFTAGTVTAALSGNATTATTLANARNIAGQSFNGSANISIAPTDLTGVTSTAAEINILDGATLSTTELNYVDGVTSAIQTQIDTKAPIASPTFTGTVTIPTGASITAPTGLVKGDVGLGNVDNTSNATERAATATLTNKTLTSPVINTPTGIVKGDVGLGSVDNTADTAKPVSTVQQTALDLKANLASPTFTGTVTIPSGASISGFAPLASPTFTGTVTVPTPTSSTDAVTKGYADAITQSLDIKDSVRVASTANITVASALTDTSTIDGVVVATGDRVLLKNQTTASQNGIYVVVASGAASRSTDANTSAKVTTGMYVFVSEGTVSADMGYVLTTDDSITLGTTALSFTQFSGAGQITASTGLSKSGNTLSIDTTVTADLTTAQTLTNKTLTSPVVNTPTGIVKGDVGLGNVDNTSNATERAASATLTNKTITSPVINTPTGIVKGDVGLGSVDNTADTAKPVSTAQQTALDLKANLASPTFTGTVTIPSGASISGFAPLASPALTGNPTATTQAAGNNTTRVATTAFVTDAVATGVAGASIDSLDEITDVTITSAASGQFLKWNGTAWVNDAIDLGTDTTGNYMSGITAGTGLTVSHTAGEGSSASVSLNATLDNLSDVSVLSPTSGEFLKYLTSSTEESAGTTWTTRTSNFGNTLINSVVYGNSLWVAAGDYGQIRTSTDAITWTTRTSNFGTTYIDEVAYGNSLWVAVGGAPGGGGPTLRSSTDAITWTTQESNFPGYAEIHAVAYGNSLWVIGGFFGNLATSTDAITWTTRASNFPMGRQISSLAYGNNLWVAGGTYGVLATSTDAITWTTRTSNFSNEQPITSVAYGNSLWVAGGYAGQLRTSTDAITWTTRTSNFGSTQILSVAYQNSLWVAGGNSGQIRTSTDAITWTTRTSNFGNTYISSVAYGNSLWVAGGSTGQLRTSETVVISSSEWVNDPINLGTDTTGSYVTSLVAGTGVTLSGNSGEGATPTIAIGQAVATNSNVTFNDLTVAGNLTVSGTTTSVNTETLTVDDNIVVLNNNVTAGPTENAGLEIERGTSPNVVLRWNETSDKWETTNDGSTYSVIATNGNIALGADTSGSYVTSLVAGTGVTLSGNSGEGATPTVTVDTSVIQARVTNVTDTEIGYLDGVTSAIQTQIDAKQATLVSATSIKTINGSSLLGSGDLTVGAAAPTTTSITANTVTTIDSFVLATYPSAEFTVQVTQGTRRYSSKSLALHNGSTVDLVQYGEISIAASEVVAGTGAVTWTTRTPNFGTTRINSVAYGNSLWVAGGNSGQLRTSTDAVTWTTRTSNFGTTRINSVAYGNSLWVAVGYSGQLRTSTDAITWTTRTSNFGNSAINSVAYGNNVWVAGGPPGQIRTSTDAITWTTRTSSMGNAGINSVVYGNNLWVAGGSFDKMSTSTDAITWTTQTANFGGFNNINTIAYGNSLWVAGGAGAGAYGPIRTSTDAITWTTRTSNFGAYDSVMSIAYANSIWVASGYVGIRTSTDAITWVTQTSNFGSSAITSVAYGNALWVAGGYEGQLRTSSTDTVLGTSLMPLTLSADISGADVRLRATITDAATTNATVKVLKTTI